MCDQLSMTRKLLFSLVFVIFILQFLDQAAKNCSGLKPAWFNIGSVVGCILLKRILLNFPCTHEWTWEWFPYGRIWGICLLFWIRDYDFGDPLDMFLRNYLASWQNTKMNLTIASPFFRAAVDIILQSDAAYFLLKILMAFTVVYRGWISSYPQVDFSLSMLHCILIAQQILEVHVLGPISKRLLFIGRISTIDYLCFCGIVLLLIKVMHYIPVVPSLSVARSLSCLSTCILSHSSLIYDYANCPTT